MTGPSAALAREPVGRANAVTRFWSSSIGKKAVMAVTGLIMVGFLVVHMVGNLQMFAGPLKINEYAAALRRPIGLLGANPVFLNLISAAVTVVVDLNHQLQCGEHKVREVPGAIEIARELATVWHAKCRHGVLQR